MKKMIIAALAISVACVPLFSGCGSGKVNYTLSEEGGKHYTVSCSGLSSLTGEYEIPAYFGEGEAYAPVTAIAAEGFANTRFSKITVPDTVTEIGTAAFSYCYSLKTVEFADGIKLENFSHGLFANSSALESIKVPSAVKEIDALAFFNCDSLSSVDLGGAEKIGARAFSECAALESVTLPDALVSIGDMAFYRSGLKYVTLPASLADTVTVDADGKETVVRGLGYAAFNSCTSLETVKIENGLKVISSAAFANCTALKEIHFPLSVEEVQGAYYADGVFRYGHAFYGDTALTDVYYDGSEEQWKDIKIETKSVYEGNTTMTNNAILNAVKHYKPDA